MIITDLKIRNCHDKDYTFVLNLLKKNMYPSFIKHWGEWNSKSFKDHFKKDIIKIVEYKKRRIAFYELKFKKDCGYINSIQITPFMQGKGIGTYLINLMEKETKKQGLKKINLKVFNDNPARRLYRRLGYRVIKKEGTSVILEKRIN